jgi:hypothetical protein
MGHTLACLSPAKHRSDLWVGERVQRLQLLILFGQRGFVCLCSSLQAYKWLQCHPAGTQAGADVRGYAKEAAA